MELDDLKKNWKAYDEKLQSTRALSRKVIVSMITDRSRSRIDTIRRQFLAGSAWMFFWVVLGVAILFTNPFDYDHTWQYAPVLFYTVCLSILLYGFTTTYISLIRTPISVDNLHTALKRIIGIYDQPRRFFDWTVVVMMVSAGILFPLSFLPKTIHSMGMWQALLERLIPISISTLLFLIAWKTGLFKQKQGDRFKADLAELEEYKAMESELA